MKQLETRLEEVAREVRPEHHSRPLPGAQCFPGHQGSAQTRHPRRL